MLEAAFLLLIRYKKPLEQKSIFQQEPVTSAYTFAARKIFKPKRMDMKKIVIATIFAAIASAASAQINKGQWLVGGDANFSSSKTEDADNRVSVVKFNPNVGYFFVNNFAGGLRVSLSSTKHKNLDDAYRSLAAAPFLRYYFLSPGEKVNVFADASYGFGKTSYGNDDRGFNYYEIKAGPAIFLTANTALEFTVGYSSAGGQAHEDNNGDVHRYNTIAVGVGFQIHLGGSKK
jgi:hypothetical protein